MRNKTERLNLIRRIIGEELISSQEELIKRLAEHGVHATQSTLSRDFKEVNISKMPHPDKGYIEYREPRRCSAQYPFFA